MNRNAAGDSVWDGGAGRMTRPGGGRAHTWGAGDVIGITLCGQDRTIALFLNGAPVCFDPAVALF